MSDDDTRAPRDYGGWRRRRGIGLFGLGAAGTLAVLGALLALAVTATADAAALVYIAPPVIIAGGLGLARVGGEPLALAAVRRLRWQCGSARHYTSYRAAVLAEHSPGFPMPGVLAPLTLLDAEDGYGGRYGIVLDRRTGLMTADATGDPRLHLAGGPPGRRRLGGQLGRLAGRPRLPARGAVGDGHRSTPRPSRARPWPTRSPSRLTRRPRWPPGRSWVSSSRPPRRPRLTSTPG